MSAGLQELVPLEPGQAALVLLGLQGFVLAPAVTLTALVRLSARQRVGRPRFVERPGRAPRLALLILPQLVLLAAVLSLGLLPILPAVTLCAQGIALALLIPSPREAVLAEQGVRRGFSARRFEELEEWRLTGEHLRWRLRGEWTSVPAPPAEQAALRARLVAASPERESPFA